MLRQEQRSKQPNQPDYLVARLLTLRALRSRAKSGDHGAVRQLQRRRRSALAALRLDLKAVIWR